MTSTARRRMLCLSLLGLGSLVSAYLLARSFALLATRVSDAIDVCSAIFGTGCDEALLSAASWQLGIPLAGWGVVYYVTLACLLVMAWALGEAFELEATLGALLLAAAGACGSVGLTVTVLVGSAPFCPLCILVHVINLALVPALWRLSGRNMGQLLRALRAGGRYLLGAQSDSPRETRWKVVGFVTAALVAVLAYQWVFVESALRRAAVGSAPDPAQVLAAYRSTPRQDVTITADDPRLGPADAPVRLVVFSSFQCPGCRAFASEMHHLLERSRGKLAIIFKHYPLGKACNAALVVDRHPRACEAAWAAEAARRQGRFWSFHDALFASDLDAGEDTIRRIARDSGLDLARFEVDRRAEATLAKVKTDIELGTRLGVVGTPAVFLDGRLLRHLGPESLEVLIHHQIASGGR